MDGILDVAKSIGDLGVLIIIAAVAIFYVVNSVKKKQKHEEKMQTQEEKKMQEYDSMIEQFVRQKLMEDHLGEEKENNTINESIVTVMSEAIKEVGACHVLCFSYHNGGKDYEGRSYQRMSCTNEVTMNCGPIQNKYNNMFRTSMFYIYTEMNKNNYFNIMDIEDIKEKDPGFYCIALQDQIHSAFGCGIHNKNGQIIGFLMYCFSEPQTENAQKIIASIKRKSYIIEGVYLASKKE